MTLDHEVEVLEHQFSRNGVKTARGEARFLDPHQVELDAPTTARRASYRADKF